MSPLYKCWMLLVNPQDGQSFPVIALTPHFGDVILLVSVNATGKMSSKRHISKNVRLISLYSLGLTLQALVLKLRAIFLNDLIVRMVYTG